MATHHSTLPSLCTRSQTGWQGGQRPSCTELLHQPSAFYAYGKGPVPGPPVPHDRNAAHSWPGCTPFPQDLSRPAPALGGYAPVPSVVRPRADPFSSLVAGTPPRAMLSAPLRYQQYTHSLPRVLEAREEQTSFAGRPVGDLFTPQNDTAARLSRTSVECQQCVSVASAQWQASGYVRPQAQRVPSFVPTTSQHSHQTHVYGPPDTGSSAGETNQHCAAQGTVASYPPAVSYGHDWATGALQPGACGSYVTSQPGVGGSYVTSQPDVGGSYVTSQPGVGGLYITSQPGVGGSYVTSRPGASGSYVTSQPGTGGLYGTSQPGAGGSYVTSQPGVGGSYVTSRPGASGSYVTSQPGTVGLYGTSQPGANGSYSTLQPGAGGSYATSQPGVSGSYGTSQPCAGGSYGTSQPCVGGSYGTSQPGVEESYGTSQPCIGGSYCTSQPGVEESYGTSQPGVSGSYGTSQPGAGGSYGTSQMQPNAPIPFAVSPRTMSRQRRMLPVSSQSDVATSAVGSSQMPPLIFSAGTCSETPPVATPVESCNTASQSYIDYFDYPVSGVDSRNRVGQGSTGGVCDTQAVMESGQDHAQKKRTAGQSQHSSQRGTAVTHTTFLRQLTSTHHPQQGEEDGVHSAANFRKTQCTACRFSSNTTTRTPSVGVQRTEREAVPQSDVQPLMQTCSGNSGTGSGTQGTSATGQKSHRMQYSELPGFMLLASSRTVNGGWTSKRNERTVRLDHLCKAIVENLMSGKQSHLETQRTAIEEDAVLTLTPLSTADTVPPVKEVLNGKRQHPDVENFVPSGSPPAVPSSQRADMSSKLDDRNGFCETASESLCRENLFCIGNENKDMAPERKEQMLRTVPVSLSHADSDPTHVWASSCRCAISRTSELRALLAPSDVNEDLEIDVQYKECLAKSEAHSQLETDVSIMSSLYNTCVGSHRSEDNTGQAQGLVSTLVNDLRDAAAVAGDSGKSFFPSDGCGDAKDICTCYDSKNREEVLTPEAAVSFDEDSRDGVWVRGRGDLFHMCLVCRRTFSNSDLLQRHLLEHMGCEGDTSDSQRPADSLIHLTGTGLHRTQTPSSTADVLGLGNSETNALVDSQRDVCGVAFQQGEAVPVEGWQSQRETPHMQQDHTADLQRCEGCALHSAVSSVPGPPGEAQRHPQDEVSCQVSDVPSHMVSVASLGSLPLKMSVCHCDQLDTVNKSPYLLTGHVKETNRPEHLESDRYPNKGHQKMETQSKVICVETTSTVISDRHDSNGSHCTLSNNAGLGADSARSAQESVTELRSNIEGDRPATVPEAPDANATPMPSPAQPVGPHMSVVVDAKQADTDHSNAPQPSVQCLMSAKDDTKSKSAAAQRKRPWSELAVREEINIKLPKAKTITNSKVTSQQKRQQCACSHHQQGSQRFCVDEHTHTDSTHRFLETPSDKESVTTNPKPLGSRHASDTNTSGAQLSQHAHNYKPPGTASNTERIVKSLKNFFARNAAVLKELACKNTQRIIVSQRLEKLKRNTTHKFVHQKLKKNHQRFEDVMGNKIPKTKENSVICAKISHTAGTDGAVQQQCFGDKTARAQPERDLDSVTCQQISHAAEEIPNTAEEIPHTAEEISHAAEEIPLTAEETSDTEEGISNTAEEIPHTAEETCYTDEEIPHEAEEICHTAEEIPHTAEEFSHTAEEIHHTAEEIPHTAEEICHTAEEIPHTAEASNQQRFGGASDCKLPEKKDDSTSFEGDCLSEVRATNGDSGCAITDASSEDNAAQSASRSKAYPCKEQGTGSDSSHSTEAQRSPPASEEEQTDMAFCWSCMTLFTKQSLYDSHGCHQARAASTTDNCSDLSEEDLEDSSMDESDGNALLTHSPKAFVKLKRAFTDRNNTFSRSRNTSKLQRSPCYKKDEHLGTRTRRGSPTLSKAAQSKDTDSRRETSCVFTCDRCEQVYSSRGGLLLHWKTVHRKIAH